MTRPSETSALRRLAVSLTRLPALARLTGSGETGLPPLRRLSGPRRFGEAAERQVRARVEELMRINAELLSAKRESEEASRSKAHCFAAAHHDLVQCLTAARLYSSALLDRDRQQGDPGLAEQVKVSLDALDEILSSLLDMARIDAGALSVEKSSIRVDEVMGQLRREFEPLAEQTGLRLVFVPSSLTIRSDRRLLKRLLQNLLSNAIKYTPRGKILVGCRRHGDEVRIEVWDTGRGIPAAEQRAIFGAFYRPEASASTPGLGLGLSIVERIARGLDHRVELRSAPGRGSVFAVTVARDDPVQAAARAASAA